MSKYLGQYFLINKDKLREIVEALELKDGDTIIEIGPGHGELTKEIVEKFKSLKVEKFKIIAIEKDEELADNLKKWSLRATEGSAAISGIALALPRNDGKIKIIKGDILKILPELSKSLILNSQSYKIVGNIPYYITGYLLRILGELITNYRLPIITIVLTIQKEVAERICGMRIARLRPSGSGNAKEHMRILKPHVMNLLAASVQFWAKPEIVGYIFKKDFQPMPEVDSAIIKLKATSDKRQAKSDKYYHFIKILFKQPRKTIMNNLLATSDKRQAIRKKIIEKLAEIGVEPNARPQDLSVEQIIDLSTLF